MRARTTPAATGTAAAGAVAQKLTMTGKAQERESSESPMLNAFCRVAPSVLFSFLAILEAGVFLFAIAFKSRTSPEVHARRFLVLLAIEPPLQMHSVCIPYGGGRKGERHYKTNMSVTVDPPDGITVAAILLGPP